MKFAPISIVLLALSAFLFGCKNEGKQYEDTFQEQEVTVPAPQKKEGDEGVRSAPDILPEKPKSDRTIRKDKGKSALDTLLPKTA
jgi:nitrogen fixation-related uncharacterized protein